MTQVSDLVVLARYREVVGVVADETAAPAADSDITTAVTRDSVCRLTLDLSDFTDITRTEPKYRCTHVFTVVVWHSILLTVPILPGQNLNTDEYSAVRIRRTKLYSGTFYSECPTKDVRVSYQMSDRKYKYIDLVDEKK